MSDFWQKAKVPDGTYKGTWSGYEVEMEVDGKSTLFQTPDGVRGIDVPVTVSVKRGKATVKVSGKKQSKARTKSQVLAARRTVVGCCNRHADNMGCDCLENAVDG